MNKACHRILIKLVNMWTIKVSMLHMEINQVLEFIEKIGK
jgi:hypothetical protein